IEDGEPEAATTPPQTSEKKPHVALLPVMQSIVNQLRAHATTAALAALALVVAGVYAYEYLPRDATETAEATETADTPASGPTTAASDPEPGTKVETAAKTPGPDPDIIRTAPSPLASKYVLTRQWKDCHESSNPDVTADACKGLIESGGLGTEDQATVRYRYARALRDKGDPDAAIESYNRAIELKPTADAYNHRGIAYYDKGDYDRAIS